MFNRKEYMKQYRLLHKEEIRIKKNLYMKNYRKTHKKECNERDRLYRLNHKNQIKAYKENHKEELKEYNKQYDKKYYQEHKEKILNQVTKYQNNKLKTDINYKIIQRLRKRVWAVLKENSKSESTLKLLGCSVEELKQHLEKQFKPGMYWDNYGTGWNDRGMKQWHIDHIIPCASFDLSKAEEQLKCFNYINLQPLWAKENFEKHDKILKGVK